MTILRGAKVITQQASPNGDDATCPQARGVSSKCTLLVISTQACTAQFLAETGVRDDLLKVHSEVARQSALLEFSEAAGMTEQPREHIELPPGQFVIHQVPFAKKPEHSPPLKPRVVNGALHFLSPMPQ